MQKNVAWPPACRRSFSGGTSHGSLILLPFEMLARIMSGIVKVLAHTPLPPFKGGTSRKQMKRATVYGMKSPLLKGDVR
jgi:hypothetical protein